MQYTIMNMKEAPLEILEQVVNMELKPIDVEECLHMGSKDTREAIGKGLAQSSYCKALMDDSGKPQAVYGVVDTPAGYSIPWLLTTSEHKITKSWLRICKEQEFPNMCEDRSFFTNVCFKSNSKTRRWLELLGFHFKYFDEKCVRFMMDVEAIEPNEEIVNYV